MDYMESFVWFFYIGLRKLASEEEKAMGIEFEAKCKKCIHKFEFINGGGMMFHSLFCDNCGEYRSLWFRDIEDLHMRYCKWLGTPYSMEDMRAVNAYPGDPLPEEEYYILIEETISECECGGKYRFDSLPKCPNCGSVDFEKSDVVLVD